MTDIIPVQNNLPAAFGVGAQDNDELSAGITGGFSVLSYRGRVWRVKHKGEEHVITNNDGDPAASIQVIMLKAATVLTKQFYAKKYEEGDDGEPDCFSSDGVRPDPDAKLKQADLCATCPKNVFGSKITDSGKKAKACSDTKRVAVVPYPDIANEAFGGPMMLRLPPSALGDLAAYAQRLKAAGLPYYGAVTKLAFDLGASYPKIKFTFVSAITDEAEANKIIEMRGTPETDLIVNTTASAGPAAVPPPNAGAAASQEPVNTAPPPSSEATAAAPAPETSQAKGAEAAEVAPQSVDDLVGSLLAKD